MYFVLAKGLQFQGDGNEKTNEGAKQEYKVRVFEKGGNDKNKRGERKVKEERQKKRKRERIRIECIE